MAEIFYPFDATTNENGEPDRVYFSEQVAAERHQFLRNGVYPNPSTGLQVVSVNNNMVLQVLSGSSLIEGRTYINNEPLEVAINTSNGSYNRKDIIVVRLNLTERNILVIYRAGTSNANPIAPTVIRNADIHELKLAEIFVRSGTQSINQADILDTRLDNTVCGMVCAVVDHVDTTTLYRQYETYLNTKIAEWNATKAQQGTDWNNQMAQQRNDWNAKESQQTTNWNNQMTQQRNDWNAKESQQTTSWNNQMTQQRNGYTAQSTEIAAWYAAVKADITKLKSFNFDNMAELGGVEKKTTFNGNISVNELIKIKNSSKKVANRDTVFGASGGNKVITETTIIYKEDGVTEMNRAIVTTTFNADKSITEVVS